MEVDEGSGCTQGEGGSSRRGRPRREDCIKRDLAEVGGGWRTRVKEGGSGEGWWRRQ